MVLAATIALSVPAVSNVVGKVSPLSSSIVSAAEEQTNLMNSNETLTYFNNVHNESEEHWVHHFHNSGDMKVDRLDFGSKDLGDLKYIVKFPEELGHLLEDEYVLDYLFGRVTNFDSAQNPFTFTGEVFDDGTLITVAKDEHKPYEHISVNKDTNSIEFDFASFYEANNLEPYVRQNVNGEFIFNTLGFTTSIVVPDDRMLDNGEYEFKSAYVRGNNVDLDNVSNAYSETLEVDYSTDPEVPEIDKDELAALLTEAEEYAKEDYTEESYAIFATAAEEALAVFENEEATQEEVDEAAANLEKAIDGLVEVDEPEEPEVDKAELEALLSEAKGYDAEDYTEDSFAALTAAIVVAEQTIDNEEATEEEVNNALEMLQSAIEGLEEIEEPAPEVDKSALEAAVATAEDYAESDYTEDSFAALASALETAEAVLANEEATQDEVDAALADLEAAIEGLVKEKTETPTEEDEEEVSIIDEDPEDEAGEGEGNVLPETATSTFNMMLIGFLVLLVGCGSLFLGRKKLN